MANKYVRSGKGIKVVTDWGEAGELCATYKYPFLDGGIRQFRVRLGPAHFTDLPRSKFDFVEGVIKFLDIKKLFETSCF